MVDQPSVSVELDHFGWGIRDGKLEAIACPVWLSG
jgi:hypothetical protein